MGSIHEQLDKLSAQVASFWRVNSSRQKWARRLVALLFGAGGAALAGWAQFQGSDTSEAVRAAGIVGVLAVLAAALWGVFVDEDKAEALATANEAVRTCDQFMVQEQEYEEAVDELWEKQRRLTALHAAVMLMREAAEQAFRDGTQLTTAVGDLLKIAAFQLRSAIAFSPGEPWTIAIFAAEVGAEGFPVLRCIAVDRYDAKQPDQVRTWPSGVGWAGAAFARNTDIIIGDLFAPELGTSNSLSGSLAHEQDSELYRSIAAVPIRVGEGASPWGVAVATSGAAHRLTTDVDDLGYLGCDVVRALAGMVALVIAGQAAKSPNQAATMSS